MKLKATIRASLWYMAAMVTAIGALLVSSGIEPWLLCGQGKQERQQGTQSPGGHGEAEKPEKGGLRCGHR